MVIYPFDQGADVLPLGLVGKFRIEGLLFPDLGKDLRGEHGVQQRVGALIGKSQLKGKMDGNFPCVGSCHGVSSHPGLARLIL